MVVFPRFRNLEFPVNFGFTRNAESEAAGLHLRVYASESLFRRSFSRICPLRWLKTVTAEAHAWRRYAGMFSFSRFLRLFPSSLEQPLTKISPLKLQVICCLLPHYRVFYCLPLSAHDEMRRTEVIVDFELNQKLDSVRRTRVSVFRVVL